MVPTYCNTTINNFQFKWNNPQLKTQVLIILRQIDDALAAVRVDTIN